MFLGVSTLIACHNYVGSNLKSHSEIPKIIQCNNSGLDSINLNGFIQEDLIMLLGFASFMEIDSIYTNQLKAQILYAKIADYIKNKVTSKEFKLNENSTEYVISLLEEKRFYLGLSAPSDSKKLFDHLKRGKFVYIWNRFVGRDYHYYLIGTILLLFLVFIIKYKNKLNNLF